MNLIKALKKTELVTLGRFPKRIYGSGKPLDSQEVIAIKEVMESIRHRKETASTSRMLICDLPMASELP